MPDISYDSRGFSIDGRRIWLVSGTVDYTRVPSELWRDHLRAAAEAGLNCVETPVVWAAHEREPGVIDFEGDLDLRHFIKTAGEAGLYVVLRMGPYVGADHDFGGLPGYLHGIVDRKGNRAQVRRNEPQYLEAVDRFWRALMQQVGDLQVASSAAPGTGDSELAAGGYTGEGGGPIVLMRVEHNWASHNPEGGSAYLERLVSMLRQQGCVVPLLNTNNLWQPIEGTIDAWCGSSDLPSMMRQLRHVQPESPAMVMAMPTDQAADHWHDGEADAIDADVLGYRIAGLIATGSQFNLTPFAAGSNLGFQGDSSRQRLADAASSTQLAPPLLEDGTRSDKYTTVKRLCTFASQFGSVIAARESDSSPVVALDESDHAVSILHQQSSQGTMVMLIKSASDKSRATSLMLPSGLRLTVPHANQRSAWVLLDTPLAGNATLDYTSLSPWALLGKKLLVVFGPAGSEGVISIDGQHHDIAVPTGKTPTVIDGDAIHVAVLNHEQIDAAYRSPAGLVIGCEGFDSENNPLTRKGWGTQIHVAHDGRISRKRVAPASKTTTPKLKDWQALSLKSLVDGSAPQYRLINEPASLGALNQPFGYGWYRLPIGGASSGKILPIDSGDRLHLYQDGKLATILGIGPGASDQPTSVKLGGDVVVLADNLGRVSDGQHIGEDPKGLPSPLYHVKKITPGKPQSIKQKAGDPFEFVPYAHHQQAGVRAMSEALAWSIKPDGRKPIVLEIDGLVQPCVVRVNDLPMRYYAAEHSGHRLRLLLDPADDGPMTGGKNEIKLELLEPLHDGVAIDKHVRFYQTTSQVTPKQGWAFANWSAPTHDDPGWRDVPKTLASQPAWLRCAFEIGSADAPLYFDPCGLSKGQVYLNGHNLGRYWHQTRESKQVRADQRLYLPECWLNLDTHNQLLIFDEHGRTPDKCSLSRTR